jgi:hypothetical protein
MAKPLTQYTADMRGAVSYSSDFIETESVPGLYGLSHWLLVHEPHCSSGVRMSQTPYMKEWVVLTPWGQS